MQVLGPAIASFGLCLLAMSALRPIAIAINLIDRPGGRKTHQGDVPVVGGLAMLLGITLGTGFVPLPGGTTTAFLSACALLVTVGLIDDRFDLSPWMRLAAQAAAALMLVFGSRTVVTSLGAPFGGGEVVVDGVLAYVLTVLIIMAGVNAFNMLDGMDGLAGAVAAVALVTLAVIASDSGLAGTLALCLVVLAAVTAFLLSNVPIDFNRDVRCFMGDSGSTLLGFAVAWLALIVSQAPAHAAQPTTMLWIVALPLYELLWTVFRRIVRGVSPLKPDTEHFHHLVLKAGFGVRGAFVIFVLLATSLAAFGTLADRAGLSESWSLALFGLSGILVIRLMYRARLLWRLLPKSLRTAALR